MFIQHLKNRLKNTIKALHLDTRGSIAIYLAAGVFAFVGIGGIATDTARAFLVKSRLSTALDAAGLAGGWSFFLNTRDTDIDMFFNTNFPEGYLGATLDGPHKVVDEENETLTLSATASVPTLFMQLFGQESVEVYAFVEVTREMQALDAVIAMDMSGSMGNSLGSGTRISAAREAASDLVDILFGDEATKDLLNLGLVPWNGKVNVTYDGSSFDRDLTVENNVATFTNPVTTLAQETTYTVNNSPVPLLWNPPTNWEGCVFSRYVDDNDNTTNGDTTEQTIDSFSVEWPAWEHIGPGSEPASSYGSDITIIQSTSRSNKSDQLNLSWDQTPKATNILIAIAQRGSGSTFNIPSGWTALGSYSADDGGSNKYVNVLAKVAGASETGLDLTAATTAHQAATIIEIANLDWYDLVDEIDFADHSEHSRNYVSFDSVYTNNTGDLLIAVAGLGDDDFDGLSWSNSFTQLGDIERTGDGTGDLTHAVGYRRVSSNTYYSTTLSTSTGGSAPTWGVHIALEDRNVCSSSSSSSGECTPCLSHGITPLSNVKANITSAINALVSPTGTTNIPQGLGWAWRVLTPEAPFTEAVANPDYNREQAIVLLTDGQNYGGRGDGYKTVFGTGNNANEDMNTRLVEIANNIKASGIVLYVIQFANNGTELQTLLQSVASGPGSPYYHYAPDAYALQDVFREVANHLSQLRLSK